MDLTISIVNWNVRDYLEKCLESIFQYANGIALEVFVVDNTSHDGSAEMVRQKFPQVKLIENRENRGYGVAHNQVLPLARGKYILFLNPDTEMLPETLAKMMSFMEIHPEAGGICGTEIRHKEKASFKKIFLINKVAFQKWKICRSISPYLPFPFFTNYCLRLAAENINSARKKPEFVECPELEAGHLLLRHAALQQAGMFDPRYFRWGESYELTDRIRKLGWKLYTVVNILLIHYRMKSFNQLSAAALDQMETEWERYVQEHGPDDINS